jgi:hypothetical protein
MDNLVLSFFIKSVTPIHIERHAVHGYRNSEIQAEYAEIPISADAVFSINCIAVIQSTHGKGVLFLYIKTSGKIIEHKAETCGIRKLYK